MNSSAFGDDSHYYAQTYVPEREPGTQGDTPDEKQIRQILFDQETKVQVRVERICKNANLAIREYLRSETALKLSQEGRRQTVPVHVVDGFSEPFKRLISEVRDPIIWRLNNNKKVLDNTVSGLSFVIEYLPNILKFFKLEESGEDKSLKGSRYFVQNILKNFENIELPILIPEIDDDLMGAYFFNIPLIQIYWMPIGIISKVLNVSVEDLTFVVLTHELAHAYSHLGSDIDGVEWDTTAFARTDRFIVEGLAQFYTQSICSKYDNRQQGVSVAFERLLDRQSPCYKEYKNWIKGHSSEVIRFSMISARSNRIIDYKDFTTEMKEIEKRIQRDRSPNTHTLKRQSH